MSRKHRKIRLICKCYREKHSPGCEEKWICECCKSHDHSHDDCKKTVEHHSREMGWKEEEIEYIKEPIANYDEWEEIVSHHSEKKKDHVHQFSDRYKKEVASSQCGNCKKKESPNCQCSDCRQKEKHQDPHNDWKKKTPPCRCACKKKKGSGNKKNGFK